MSEEENIPKEQISNSKEENVNENISPQETIEQPETEIGKSEIITSDIQNMEVHHHSKVEKKNFKEYFLEFIMIFLAVTVGFFAESLREHFVDKKHEKQYIRSFYEDLSADQVQLPELINAINRQQLRGSDSLLMLLKNADTTSPANSIYYFLRSMIRQQGIRAFISDRTISQAENSGEMRLIDKQISDSLTDYYKGIYYIAYLQESLLKMKEGLTQNMRPVLNGYDYARVIDSNDAIIYPNGNLHLRSADRTAINNCVMSISEIKGLSVTIKYEITLLITKAGNIQKLISRKYGS